MAKQSCSFSEAETPFARLSLMICLFSSNATRRRRVRHRYQHCWMEDAAYFILDPSLVLLVRQSDAIFYFPALRRDQRVVASLACKKLPLVRSCGTYGPDGMGHPDYLTAYRTACQKAETLASAHNPGKPVIVEPAAWPFSEPERLRLTVQIVSSSAWLQGCNQPADREEPDDEPQGNNQDQERIDTNLA